MPYHPMFVALSWHSLWLFQGMSALFDEVGGFIKLLLHEEYLMTHNIAPTFYSLASILNDLVFRKFNHELIMNFLDDHLLRTVNCQ